MLTDMLTKRLGFQKVKHLCDLIGLALVVNDEPITSWLMFRRKRVFSGVDGRTDS